SSFDTASTAGTDIKCRAPARLRPCRTCDTASIRSSHSRSERTLSIIQNPGQTPAHAARTSCSLTTANILPSLFRYLLRFSLHFASLWQTLCRQNQADFLSVGDRIPARIYVI